MPQGMASLNCFLLRSTSFLSIWWRSNSSLLVIVVFGGLWFSPDLTNHRKLRVKVKKKKKSGKHGGNKISLHTGLQWGELQEIRWIPLGHSRLSVWHCHSCGTGFNMAQVQSLASSPGTSMAKKKKRRNTVNDIFIIGQS